MTLRDSVTRSIRTTFSAQTGGISKVSEYRQHAKECRSLAKTVRFSQHREMLQSMAAAWESLRRRSDQDRGRAGANCQTRKSGAEGPQAQLSTHRRADRVRDVDAGCEFIGLDLTIFTNFVEDRPRKGERKQQNTKGRKKCSHPALCTVSTTPTP
jgi:hypothetical protein